MGIEIKNKGKDNGCFYLQVGSSEICKVLSISMNSLKHPNIFPCLSLHVVHSM